MKILGIETASSAGGVALAEDERVIAEQISSNPRTNAERILPSIDRMLREAGWKIKDLDLVAVSVGPGSFTGLRIGIATAKGLAFSAGLPVVGVPTLDAFASMHAPAPHPIRPVLDARKEEVFTAAFDNQGKRLGPDIHVRPQVLLEIIKKDGPVLLVGDGARRYRDVFEKLFENGYFASQDRDDPRPGAVAIMGRRRLLDGALSDPDSIAPKYVRLSDAEIESRPDSNTT